MIYLKTGLQMKMMFILPGAQWTFLKLNMLEPFPTKPVPGFPYVDLTVKSLAAELKGFCERVSWHMGSNENVKFSCSPKWYSLIKLMWGRLRLQCV